MEFLEQVVFRELYRPVERTFDPVPTINGVANASIVHKNEIEKRFGVPVQQIGVSDFFEISFPERSGYYCLFQKSKNEVTTRNTFFTSKEIEDMLERFLDRSFGMDTYVSYSSFHTKKKKYMAVDGKRKAMALRTQSNIVKTYMLVQDLDFYKHGVTIYQAYDFIAQLVKSGKIICPTFINLTGRGIQLVWVINPFKNIEGFRNDLEWREVQMAMYDVFEAVGLYPDTVVKNPSAVTRLTQTLHSGSRELVKTFYLNAAGLFLDDFVFFHDLTPKADRKVKARAIVSPKPGVETPKPLGAVRQFQWNEFTLNRLREEDILTYTKEAPGMIGAILAKRNWLCLVLCFHALVSSGGDKSYAYSRLNQFWSILDAQGDTEGTSIQELERRSLDQAIQFYDEWINGTWDTTKYVTGGLFYKNLTMLQLMGIEKNYEMQHKLRTIKIKNKEYEAARKRIERKAKGETKVNNETIHAAIIKFIKGNPDLKDHKIAELVKTELGKCSKNTVQKVRKSLGK